MYPFFETIRYKNGMLENVSYHQARINRTLHALGGNTPIDLDKIQIEGGFEKDIVYKIKCLYNLEGAFHIEKEIYRQGFCKNCFFDIPSAGDWIMRPELSKAHLGIEDRNLDYETSVQLTPHIVYLANSSNVKVGVTRKTQVPTRWIDQGAHAAIEIVEVPNRYLAGITEVALKNHVADKTNWRKMLKNDIEDVNLIEWREKLKEFRLPWLNCILKMN